jgi:hypothetical protein
MPLVGFALKEHLMSPSIQLCTWFQIHETLNITKENNVMKLSNCQFHKGLHLHNFHIYIYKQ